VITPGIILGFSFFDCRLPGASGQFDIIPSPVSSLIGITTGGGFLWLTAVIYAKVRGREGMGGGDIKLLAMIGAFLGWPSILVSLLLGCLTGSVFGLASMAVTRSGFKLDLAIPFGPFLCTGATLYLFFGEELTALYLYPQ
jgi:leader peptidase (prepilin peptidase)/N-methyltransferase